MTTGQCPCGHDGGPREEPHHSNTTQHHGGTEASSTPAATQGERREHDESRCNRNLVREKIQHDHVGEEGEKPWGGGAESGARRQAMAGEIGEGKSRRSGAVTETLNLGLSCAWSQVSVKSRSMGKRWYSRERALDCALARRRKRPEHVEIGRRRRRQFGDRVGLGCE